MEIPSSRRRGTQKEKLTEIRKTGKGKTFTSACRRNPSHLLSPAQPYHTTTTLFTQSSSPQSNLRFAPSIFSCTLLNPSPYTSIPSCHSSGALNHKLADNEIPCFCCLVVCSNSCRWVGYSSLFGMN